MKKWISQSRILFNLLFSLLLTNFYRVQHLVLDEGDKLLELGLVEQVDTIIAACTLPTFQKVLFSATLPSGIETLATSIMHDVSRVVIGAK